VVRFATGDNGLSFPKLPDPICDMPMSLLNGYRELFPGMKQPDLEADLHLVLKIKNTWSCFSALECAFMACIGAPLVVYYPSCGRLGGPIELLVRFDKGKHSFLLSGIEPRSRL
jgi:hypothetical protein